jgi:hypothetical protein
LFVHFIFLASPDPQIHSILAKWIKRYTQHKTLRFKVVVMHFLSFPPEVFVNTRPFSVFEISRLFRVQIIASNASISEKLTNLPTTGLTAVKQREVHSLVAELSQYAGCPHCASCLLHRPSQSCRWLAS